MIFNAPPVVRAEPRVIAWANPVVNPVAFWVKSPVVVVAPLAVKSRSFPVVVMTEVSEMEANVGVMAPLPVTWNSEPEAAPAVVLVKAPVEEIFTKPVVASRVAAPVGPLTSIAPPVVRVVEPFTLMAWAYPVVNPVAFWVSKPVAVVAELAVRVRRLPVVVRVPELVMS